jgi:hypothetical protein
VEDHVLVADFQVDWVTRSSLEDDGIVACPAHCQRDLTPGIRFRVDPGLRGFGKDGIPTGAVVRGVREGTGGEDQTVPRRKRVHPRRVFIQEEKGAESLSAEVGLENRIRDEIHRRSLAGEVDAQESIEKALHGLIIKEMGRAIQHGGGVGELSLVAGFMASYFMGKRTARMTSEMA